MEYTPVERENLEFLKAQYKATEDGKVWTIRYSSHQRIRFRLMGDDVNVLSMVGRNIFRLAQDLGFKLINTNSIAYTYVNRKHLKITFLEFVVLVETLKTEYEFFKLQQK